jgi:tetratricopeptide (TPR) repeat protein
VAATTAVTNDAERKTALDAGFGLIRPHLKHSGRVPQLSDEARAQIHAGIEYLFGAVRYDARDWPALFFIGKAYQALADHPRAYEALRAAYTLQDRNAGVAREFGLTCIELGFAEPAIAAMQRAIALTPDDTGLYTNLALAYLIAGKNQHALDATAQSLAINPADGVSGGVRKLVTEVMAGKRPQPKSAADF